MQPAGEDVLTCDGCGAVIYPEQLHSGRAERLDGKLLCAHCVSQRRAGTAAPGPTAPAAGAQRVAPPISLREDIGAGAASQVSPRASSGPAITFDRPQRAAISFRRPLLKDSPHATRCRTFHCRLNEASIANMNDQINEWVDSSDEICIKFATSSIGIAEGKHADPHLFITVFY